MIDQSSRTSVLLNPVAYSKSSAFKSFNLCIVVSICIICTILNGCASKPPAHVNAAVTFYISTDGDDRWSGTIPSPSILNRDGPFATFERARDVIRQMKTEAIKGQFTVIVRGGIYRFTETFILGPEDSGTESGPTVYKAYRDERPVLTGTQAITNFKTYKGKILYADLKGTLLGVRGFKQLFTDGVRQTLARYPNADPSDPIGGGFLHVENTRQEPSKIDFKYKEGCLRAWPRRNEAEVVIFPGENYGNDTIAIASIEEESRTVTLAKSASYTIKVGNRYYFQNLLEELDAPGEWYFDRSSKMVYFWPSGETSFRNVYAPVLQTIVQIRANPKGNLAPEHIRFEGFTLEGCEGTAIAVTGAKNTVIARNTVFNAGGDGIHVDGEFQNAVIGNDIYEVGGFGISISGGDERTLEPAKNMADNNVVHHSGIVNKGLSAIQCNGVGNIISHNYVHTTPRYGIGFGGNDHLIEYNEVHSVNRETQDSGIINTYAIDWTKQGTIIRFNYVHDSGGYGRNGPKELWRSPFYTWGIYLDDWTSGTTIYGNIVARTSNGGVYIHGGKDNIIENNIIIDGGNAQIWLYSIPRNDPHVPSMLAKVKASGHSKYPCVLSIRGIEDATMSGNRLIKNIISYRGETSALYLLDPEFDMSKNVLDHNAIIHSGLPPLIPYMQAPPDQQWKRWKEKGMDVHSTVIDNLPDVEDNNFQIQYDKAALHIGFKPIPIKAIGPYNDSMRASWPVK